MLIRSGLAALLLVSCATPRPADDSRCPDEAQLRGAEPPRGEISLCELPDGRRHGKLLSWHENGLPKKSVEYRYGARHGEATTWHWNGVQATHGRYRNDTRDDVWRQWTPEGQLLA